MNRLTWKTSLLGLAVAAVAVLPAAARAGGAVNVYYAGSLAGLNENAIGPAFQARTGYSFQGVPEGSQLIVNQLRAHLIQADVIEFADASLNGQLMGRSNHNILRWYVTFARTHLVVGFDPKSRYASSFRMVQRHKLPWYKPLLAKGLRFGRTDPNADPKGYRVIFAFRLAQKLYHLHDFERRVLGSTENPSQIFPEQTLVGDLSTGNLDAGIFYLAEAKAAHIPYIGLPREISFGDPRFAKLDATQHYRNSQGVTVTGSPVYYTISIPSSVKNKAAAVAFVRFVFKGKARRLASKAGLQPTRPVVYGDKKAAPRGI